MLSEKVLAELCKRLDEENFRSYSKSIGTLARKRLYATLFFNLNELKNKFSNNLRPFTLIGIEQRMNWIKDWLQQEAWGHFFGNLYQVEYSLLNNNRQELQNQLSWTIEDLHTAHVLILNGSNLTDSLGSAFLERLNGLVTVDCKLIDKKDREFFKLALINLCNVMSVLNDYLNMAEDACDEKGLAKHYIEVSFKSLKKAFTDKEISDEDINLSLFVYLTLRNSAKSLNEKIDDLEEGYRNIQNQLETGISELKAYNVILSLCNIYYLDKAKFRELFENEFERFSTKVDWVNRPFFVRMLILYLQDVGIGEEIINLKIRPAFESLKTDEIIEKLFPEFFSEKLSVSVNADDIERLMKFDDGEIRNRLVNILQRSKYLSAVEKERLIEEGTKPHTGGEISDFEVRIELGPYDIIQACLPIKSAREIKTPSVSEKYAYQIMKPFIRLYDKCVVIFVTSKRCSQALDAYIKQLVSLYGFPIAIIQEGHLCTMFKFYGQL